MEQYRTIRRLREPQLYFQCDYKVALVGILHEESGQYMCMAIPLDCEFDFYFTISRVVTLNHPSPTLFHANTNMNTQNSQ